MTTTTKNVPSLTTFVNGLLGKLEEKEFYDMCDALQSINPKFASIAHDATQQLEEVDDAVSKTIENFVLSGMNPLAIAIAANKFVVSTLTAAHEFFTSSPQEIQKMVGEAFLELAKSDPELLSKLVGKHTKH